MISVLFIVFCLNKGIMAIGSPCITPNLEKANCTLLESCSPIFDGIKALNDTVIEFARTSMCKTEDDNFHVCCGSFAYFIHNPCINHNNENGRCVKLELCPTIFSAVKSLNFEAISFAKKSVCKSEDDKSLSVCCPLTSTTTFLPLQRLSSNNTEKLLSSAPSANIMQLFSRSAEIRALTNTTLTPLITSTSTTPLSTTKKVSTPPPKKVTNTTSPSTIKINPQTSTKPPTKNPLSDRRFCGLQHTDGNQGTATDQFPWVALLQHENSTGIQQQHCLGVLINSRYVLTTAICVNNTDAEQGFKITSVRLGVYDSNSTKDCVPSGDFEDCAEHVLKIGVEKTILHPNFKLDPSGIGHNIALIRLIKNIAYSDYVRPICLPDPIKSSRMGDIVTTSGWGTTTWEENIDKKLKIKKRGTGVLVPLQDCIETSDINLEAAINTNNHLCFREESGNGPCLDDSSAPLMSSRNKQWQLEGIAFVPISQRCGKGALTVFMNVTSYIKWIENTVEP